MCLLSLFCKYISQSEINITIVIETKRNQDTALIKKITNFNNEDVTR